MRVNIKGIRKLDANYFEQINISEDTKKEQYSVVVYGERDLLSCNIVGIKFSDQIRGMSSYERIVEIIQRYLENVKINSISNPIGSAHRKGKWIYIKGNNGNKVLRLQLFNSRFDKMLKMIDNKYLNDRYDYFWNNDIKKMNLVLDSKKSSYDVYPIECDNCKDRVECLDNKDSNYACDTYINCSVKTDKETGIFFAERIFLTEYLNYRLWQIGEEAFVKTNSVGKEDSLNRYISSHIIRCGDFELSFPHKEEFMFIFGIVNDYNNQLFEIKMNEKKRQLKMEGI